MKKKLCVLIALMAAFVLCVPAACGGKKDPPETVLSGFTVSETAEANFGSLYKIPVLTVTDQDGNVMTVEVSVRCGDDEVSASAGQFVIDKMADYTLTFSVTVAEGDVRTLTQTVKVKDGTAPTLTLSDIPTQYLVGDEVTLPEVASADDVDETPQIRFAVTRGETDIAVADGKFTADKTGIYLVTVTASDAAGNSAVKNAHVYVRNAPQTGEIESFDEEASLGNVDPCNNDTYDALLSGFATESVGGRAPTGGGGFLSFSSRFASKTGYADYPGLSLTPRSSKDALTALASDGYDMISVYMYIDADNSHSVYNKWAGEGDKQVGVYNLPVKTWNRVDWPLQKLIDNYDKLSSGEKLLFYLGNHPDYAVNEGFTVYLDGIYATKDANPAFAADFAAAARYETGNELSLEKMPVECETEGLTFVYTVTAPDGSVRAVTAEDTLVFEDFGDYTFKAELSGQKNLRGDVSKTVKVYPVLAQVQQMMTDAAAMPDKTSDEYLTLMRTLKKGYDSLIQDDRDAIGRGWYDFLLKEYSVTERDNTVVYFDSAMGYNQIHLTETYIPNGNNPFYEALSTAEHCADDVGGVTASTKFTVKQGSGWVYFLCLTMPDMQPVLGDVSAYDSLTFRVYVHQKDRPVGLRVTNTDRYKMQDDVMNLTADTWVDVTVDLSKGKGFVGWDDIQLNFFHTGWGSITPETEIYMTPIVAVPKKSLDDVNALMDEIAGMDGTEADYAAKLNSLKRGYDNLSAADKRLVIADYNALLMAVCNVTERENTVVYFDSAMGASQIYLSETYADAGNGPFYQAMSKTGQFTNFNGVEAGTKITVGQSVNQWVYFLTITFPDMKSLLGDIRNFQSVAFKAYIVPASGGRDLIYRITKIADGTRTTIRTQESFAMNTWVDISIDLAQFSSWDEIQLNFVGKQWGSMKPGTQIYLTPITAEPVTAAA